MTVQRQYFRVPFNGGFDSHIQARFLSPLYLMEQRSTWSVGLAIVKQPRVSPKASNRDYRVMAFWEVGEGVHASCKA